MWGLILAGAILVAIAVIIEVIYSYSLLKPVPWLFYFVPGGTDYAGEFIALIGLILIMAGGYMTREPKE